MDDNFKVSTPRVNPAKVAATKAASKDPASARIVNPVTNTIITDRRQENKKEFSPSVTPPPKIKIDPEKTGGNGPFDFAYFQSLMDDYLEANQFEVVKKTTKGSKFFKGALAFISMVIAFLLAIYIAMQLGILS